MSQHSLEYFWRTYKASLNHCLGYFLDGDRGEQVRVSNAADSVGELVRTHGADGPFMLDGRVGLRRTVQVNLIPMVYNCLRVSKGAWVQIPLLSYLLLFFYCSVLSLLLSC
ncbi:hypothetical protein N7445_005317 [Penicillium cf. griseofulvum]|nr:hypothetical protein N7445_005317 [Penicillium cf. griseofulvum]